VHPEKQKVIFVDYSVRTIEGELVDESEPGEPLEVRIGGGQLIETFENAVKDLDVGDERKFEVPPEQGYGLRDDSMVQEIPLTEFPNGMTPQAGVVFSIEDEEGHAGQFQVTSVGLESATCDFNHPLAGQTLNFQVKVIRIEEQDWKEPEEDDDEMDGGHECTGCGHHH